MQRAGIYEQGPGYRPNDPFAEAKIFDPEKNKECPIPSGVEERHPAVLYESQINKRH
jgi:hypothetical protein